MKKQQEEKINTDSSLQKDLGLYKKATKKAFDYQRQRLLDERKPAEEKTKEVE